MMLGIQDPWVVAAYLLCILSALICVVWGVFTWSKPAVGDDEPEEEIRHWAEEEDKVEQEL